MRKFLTGIGAVAVLALPATGVSQQVALLLFGGDGHKEFLGCLNCAATDGASVWNKMSEHGWENGYGQWGEYGDYGGKYGDHSACNTYASDPPVIVDKSGNLYGRLSVSKYVDGSVCGISGVERICIAVKAMCAHID